MKITFMRNEKCIDIIDENSLIIIIDVHNESHVENIDVVNIGRKSCNN